MDLLACLCPVLKPSLEPLDVDVQLFGGAAFVNMNLPRRSKTYGKYCDVELKERISDIPQNNNRLDLVLDLYRTNSTKSQARASHGKNVRVSVRKKKLIHKEFLRNNESKTEPFEMIANGNKQELLEELQPCNYGEADYWLLPHVYDTFQKRFRKLSIITVDTEITRTVPFFSLHVNELWVDIEKVFQ